MSHGMGLPKDLRFGHSDHLNTEQKRLASDRGWYRSFPQSGISTGMLQSSRYPPHQKSVGVCKNGSGISHCNLEFFWFFFFFFA